MTRNKFFFECRRILIFSLFSLFILSAAYAQKARVTGSVSDVLGKMIGVSVSVKGTSMGTVTDAEGNYSLDVSPNAVLQFTFIGYVTKEVPVKGKKIIDIQLQEDSQQLDEVVVVGYGAVKKSDLTGAVASVKAEDLNFPTSSVSEMLRGKAAGVQISLTSGRPGSGSSMLIRGEKSLSGSNAPLYIVDGATVETINDINPNDISSIEILKDASSQAIYGARAANGVVLISTKRGKSGKAQITYDMYVGTQKLWKNFDFYNADEFYELRWQGRRNDDGLEDSERVPSIILADPMMEEMYEKREFVDWNELMFKNALSQQHSLSVRGGTDKIRASFSMGYLNQDGMVTKSGYKRLNLRFNVDYDVNKYLSVGANTAFSKAWTQTEDGGFEEFTTRPPIAKVHNEDGTFTSHLNSEGLENPLYKIQESDSKSVSDRLNLNVFLDIKPFKGLNYRMNVAYKTRFSESGNYQTKNYPKAKTNSASLSNTYFNNILLENILTYKVKFTEKHKLDFTFVQSIDKDETRTLSTAGTDLPMDFFQWDGLSDAVNITKLNRGVTERLLLSYLGRINYTLMDKYLLTVAMRRDGSSVFGKNHKWGNFPSVAVGWKLSEEEFIKPLDWVSNLKLRLSYGHVGNQGVDPYTTLGVTSSYDMVFGDDVKWVGYLPGSSLKNPNLKWESTASTNVGLDFGFFNHRITGSVEYFNSRTTDLLVTRKITSTTGYTSVLDNLAETKSHGWELVLGADIIRAKELNWSANATFSRARNEVVRVNDKVDEFGKPKDDIDNHWYIGHTINSSRRYEFNGIYQTSDDTDGNGFVDFTVDTNGDGIPDRAMIANAKPGDIKLVDINGDGIITDADQIITSKDPDWMGSISTNLAYKGFDLYLDFYTVQGGLKSNANLKGGNLQGKLNAVKVNYWTPENASNEYPRPSWGKQAPYNSALGYQDASYFRFRTLTFGYTLPKNITQSFMVEKLRMYFTATNLFTSTDVLSYSPELSLSSYPEPQQFIFGLNVQF